MVTGILARLKARAQSGLGRNSLASVGQTLTGILALFLVYREAIVVGGTELIGLWSLTIGLVSVARLADLSGGGALARLAAVAETDADRAAVIDAVALFQVCFYGVLCLVVFWPFQWALDGMTEDVDAWTLQFLVLGTLASLVMNVLAMGQANALDGVMRADLRALAHIIGFVVFAVAGLILLPDWGIIGLAAAQFAQMVITLAVARGLLYRMVPGLAVLPIRGTMAALKGAISYGIRLQMMGLAGLIFDPLSRFAINHVAGLGTLGIYEIAYRLVAQTRSLLNAAATPLVPVFAKQHEAGDHAGAEAQIMAANRMIGWAAVLGLGALCLSAPLIEMLILPESDPLFLLFVVGLSVGYCGNALGIAIFLYAQGSGRVLWNILGQLGVALFTLTAIQVLALFFPTDYAALGTALGLSLGTLVIIIGNARRFGFNGARIAAHSLLSSACVVLFGLLAFQLWEWQ